MLLSVLSPLYRLAVEARLRLYRSGILRTHRLPHPVVSVGNITAGGTGKTPLVMYLAQSLKQAGLHPAILTRGYKGTAEQAGGLVSDGSKILLGADEGGDEACLMASKLEGVPIAVGGARHQSARLVPGFGVDSKLVFLLDDAYQHLQLVRDLNILVLDATDPFGGGRLLPGGRLREPLSAMSRADLIIVTRAHLPFDVESLETEIRLRNRLAKISYFYHDAVGAAELKTGRLLPLRHLLQKKVVALSGIGNPQVFLQDLNHYQLDVVKKFSFRDHYRFTRQDVEAAEKAGHLAGADAVVTTEKDAVRLDCSVARLPFYALQIQARPEDSETFDRDFLQEVRDCLQKLTL
ncbi:MAG: tetraacyldisaccharide 4'-kinase [Acidobacteria bacterium]|nr:MAG: tetraacyldisaccharide 4'-kinase [Acidobacteriota bacterium]